MRSFLVLTACCIFQAIALPAQAAPHLGATLQEIRTEYVRSELSEMPDARPVLTLQGVDYDGVHWNSVRFIFGPTRRLQSMTMTTQAVSYEDVVAQIRRGAEAPNAAGAAEENATAAFQIRICDDGEGRVTLTYEPATTPA